MAGYCQLRGINDDNWTDFEVNVMIMAYKEGVDVLDGEAAGRVKLTGSMIRDPLGAFLGHNITFEPYESVEEFDKLWTWLLNHCVEDYVWLRAADNQTTIDQKVYYTHFDRTLERASDGVNRWASISVNFIGIDSIRKPT